MKNFWQRCEQFPPCLVRLLARHPHGKPLTDEEIGARMFGEHEMPSSATYIARTVADQVNWDSVTVPLAKRFLQACGVDFCNVRQCKKVDSYFRSKPTFLFLRRSPEWKTKYEPLLRKWRESLAR